jgi:hypothetical protein
LSPHGDARLLADSLTLAADALLVVLFARAIPRGVPPASPAFDRAWGLAVTAIPLLSPLTEEHHLVVLLFPLTLVLMAKGETRFPSTESVLLLVSILLLGSRYSVERFPFFQQGLPALLATGKLLGTVCLAWLLTRLAQHEAPSESVRIE